MASDVQQSTKITRSDDAIITENAEIAKSPSSAQDKLWSFLKIVLQLLGVLQILIGLINTSLWTKWALWLSIYSHGFVIFTSGYAVWGGLSFTISGIFSLISAKISSKALVKCCLITSMLSASASLAGIIIIHLDMIVNHRCQRCHENFICYKNIATMTAFMLVKLMLATMEFSISTFLITLSVFQIKVPEEKSSIPFENPYEDLLFQPDPYDEIQPEQGGYEQCDP